MNRKLGLLQRRVYSLRAAIYTLVGIGVGLAYLMGVDAIGRREDERADRNACRLGPSYARGGVEYYEKALTRNLALKALQPNSKAAKDINANGDARQGILRIKEVPTSKRRRACFDALQELEGAKS